MTIKISDIDQAFGSDLPDEALQARIKAAQSGFRAALDEMEARQRAAFMGGFNFNPTLADMIGEQTTLRLEQATLQCNFNLTKEDK